MEQCMHPTSLQQFIINILLFQQRWSQPITAIIHSQRQTRSSPVWVFRCPLHAHTLSTIQSQTSYITLMQKQTNDVFRHPPAGHGYRSIMIFST